MKSTGLVSLAIAFALILCACQHRFVSGSNVWTLDSRGRAFVDTQIYRSGYSQFGKGASAPLLSRDLHYVAYVDSGDVWIKDMDGTKSRQLTKTAKAKSDTHVEVFNLVSSWSPDGSHLLVYVGHGDDTCEDCQGGTLLVPTGSYGFHAINLNSGDSQQLDLADPVVGWIDNRRVLQVSSVAGKNTLTSLDILDGRLANYGEMPEQFGTASVSFDGRYLLFDALSFGTAESSVRIMKRTLMTGSDESIAGPMPVGTLGKPGFSPTDRGVSYLLRNGTTRQLIVNGKVAFGCEADMEYSWLSERTIAVRCGKRVNVVRINSGHVLGRYVVETQN